MIPKSNRPFEKEALNQSSLLNVSHFPEELKRYLRLSRQVDLDTVSRMVALFTVHVSWTDLLGGTAGKEGNARTKRKVNKEYNCILDGAAGTVLYKFD